MAVPDNTLHLGGLTLAHAALGVSALEVGEALSPMAFVRRGPDLQLMRFEAPSQELAIKGGKATLDKQQSSLDAWAFAREGLMDAAVFGLEGAPSSESGKVDVLSIDVWSYEMEAPITFVQPFRPQSTGEFRVVGEALVLVKGSTLSGKQADRLRKHFYAGVKHHEKVAPMWKRWRET